MTELTQTPPKDLPEIPSSWEKFIVLIIFGGLTAFEAYKGNDAAMTGFSSTIVMYFLSRQGV